jgi:hypothetical protein
MYVMRRTTVFLDDKLLRDLQRVARAKGVSFATVVREALSGYLTAPGGAGSVPSIAGRFTSGSGDTSERVDELLWHDPHA